MYVAGGKAYDATLNQSNLGQNNNKFYIIQVLQNDSNANNFYVWNRWGRVGVAGQNAMKGPMGQSAAVAEYNKKFRDKTEKGDYQVIEITQDDETQNAPV